MNERLAEALDNCLTSLAAGQTVEDCLARYPEQRAALEPLLRVGQALWAAKPATASENMREAGRVRLLNRIAARQASQPTRGWRLPRWRPVAAWPRLAGVLAAVLVAMVAMSGAVVASASALPDEPLYPVKQGVEWVQLTLASDEASRASLYLQFAERRLSEDAELAKRGRARAADAAAQAYGNQLDRALQAVEQEQASGGEVDALVGKFSEHLDRHQATLAEVLGQVPDEAKSAIEKAMVASQQGQQRAMEIKEQKLRAKNNGADGAKAADDENGEEPGGAAGPNGNGTGAAPDKDGKAAPPGKDGRRVKPNSRGDGESRGNGGHGQPSQGKGAD